MRTRALPSNFTLIILGAKHSVHYQFQVVTGGRVAVQIDAAGGFQDAVQLNQSLGHHGEVGHHIVLAEEGAHSCQQFPHFGRPSGNHILIGAFRFQAPVPSVVESSNLGRRLVAAALAKQHVVGGIGIEGRVEINQVNAGVGNVLAEDGQVVAEVEAVGG